MLNTAFSPWTPQHCWPLPTTHFSQRDFHNPTYRHGVLWMAGSWPFCFARDIFLMKELAFHRSTSTALMASLRPRFSFSTHFIKCSVSQGTQREKKKSHTPTQQNCGADHDRDHDCSAMELALQKLWLSCSPVFLFLKCFSNLTEFFTHKESNNRVEPEEVVYRDEGKYMWSSANEKKLYRQQQHAF